MNQIKTGAIISYVALFLNIIIGLLYTPWMINAIGKADYGLYTLAMSVISLFVFDFGLGSAITRFVSKYLAESRQDKVDNLLGLVFKLYLIGDFVILIVLSGIYFLIPSMYQGLTLEEMSSFKIVYLISSFFCVVSFPFIPLNGVITSYERFVQLKSCDLIHKLLIVVLMTGCLLLGGGLYSLVIVHFIAGVIIILMKLVVLGKTRIAAIKWRCWDKVLLKSVLGFSVWVTIIQLAQRCIFNIAPSILAVFATSSAITILGIAICLEGYSFSLANAMNGMFMPKVSRMLADNNKEQILQLMTRVGRIQIYILGLIIVGFISVGENFVSVWLGDGYEDVYICTIMLILPSIFHLPQDIGTTTLFAEGKVRFQSYAFIFMALLNLVLAFPFTRMWGVHGLCLSIMIAYFARTMIMDYIFYKELRLNIFRFFKDSYFKIFPSFAVALVVIFFINRFILIAGWTSFLIKTVVCIIIYGMFVWILAMNKEEKGLITSPLKRMLRK